MELSFEDFIKMNEMQLQEDITPEAIERFLGDMTSFAEQRNPLEFKKVNLPALERILVEDTTENLYRILVFNPVLFSIAISRSNKDLKKPEDIKGYAQNMQKIYEELLKFEAEVEKAVELKVAHKYMIFSNPAVRESFSEFMKFMKQFMPFFEYAVKLDSICSKTRDTNIEFFNLIGNYNGAIRDILSSSRDTLSSSKPLNGNWSDLGDHFESMYIEIMKHFEEYSTHIESKKEAFEAEEERRSKVMAERVQQAKNREPIVNEKEIARQKSIKEANDLYEMFQMDFMRDLNREVSMMNRDMYERLLDKIEKFLQKFPMPLASDVSMGMAEEAKAQIQRFIDTVGEISRNTYTTMIIQKQ